MNVNAPERRAVIDLGTNTFHLLIAEHTENGFREIYRERIYVKLALNGINTLTEKAMERGLDALMHFKEMMVNHRVDEVRAIGTAALRTAENADVFIARVSEKLTIEIEIIDGDREADLIHKGVMQVCQLEDLALIMDIGGGSVEFILCDQNRSYFCQSLPIGVAILYNEFHHNEPISSQETFELESFLTSKLAGLKQQIEYHQPSVLVGASGTFDVIDRALSPDPGNSNYTLVNVRAVSHFIDEVLAMDLSSRRIDPRIPESRADMIVVALILLRVILDTCQCRKVGISKYALKEGVLAEF